MQDRNFLIIGYLIENVCILLIWENVFVSSDKIRYNSFRLINGFFESLYGCDKGLEVLHESKI